MNFLVPLLLKRDCYLLATKCYQHRSLFNRIILLLASNVLYLSLFAQVQKNKKTQQTDRQTDRHRDRQGVYSYRKQSKQSLNIQMILEV